MWSRLRARVSAFGRMLLAAHTSPARLGLAVLVGAMVGCTPPLGLHFFLCVGLAWVLGLNQVVVYAAANISIPPLMPFIGFASIELGERLLHGRFLPLSPSDVRAIAGGSWQAAGRLFADWAVGGLPLGATIGALFGGGVYAWSSRRARAAPDVPITAMQQARITSAIRAASRRYRAAEPAMRWYAWFKYRLDPVYRRVAELVPEGSLTIDVGTGLGMLPLVLASLGGGRRALGIDWDEKKLAAAKAAAADLDGIQFVEADASGFALPACEVVTLIDVLHYQSPESQRALLVRCLAALAPEGKLLVRDGDGARGGVARWTRALEALAVRLGWNRAPATRFRDAHALSADLEALGLIVQIEPLSGPLHPGNVLLTATRAPAAAIFFPAG